MTPVFRARAINRREKKPRSVTYRMDLVLGLTDRVKGELYSNKAEQQNTTKSDFFSWKPRNTGKTVWTKEKLEYTNLPDYLLRLFNIKSTSTSSMSKISSASVFDEYIIFCFSSFSRFTLVCSSSVLSNDGCVNISLVKRAKHDRVVSTSDRNWVILFIYSRFCRQYVVQALFSCRRPGSHHCLKTLTFIFFLQERF